MLLKIVLVVMIYIILVQVLSRYGYKICHTKIGWYLMSSSGECRNCMCKYAHSCKRNTVYKN